jgi:hypothetical protein
VISITFVLAFPIMRDVGDHPIPYPWHRFSISTFGNSGDFGNLSPPALIRVNLRQYFLRISENIFLSHPKRSISSQRDSAFDFPAPLASCPGALPS